MRKILIFLVVISVAFVSCENAFIDEDEPNNPENNFELLWNDFDQHYGLFTARNKDWDSIYAKYRPQITQETTNEELFTVFTEMLGYLDDGHTWLYDTNDRNFFASGSIGNDIVEQEFSKDLIRSTYLENVVHFEGDATNADSDGYFYGTLKNKDIGYIYMQNIDLDNEDVIDEVLSAIGDHKALVFDIRNNGGGDDLTAAAIAGRFTTEEKYIYSVQEKNGPKHNDFGPKLKYYTKKQGSQHFDKPIILITDKITISAADVFCLHMKSLDNVTQIGTPTAGDYSDVSPDRFLPNGWTYGYSIMMFLLPDGTSQDGIGSIPDVTIKNTVQDIEANEDKVLEKSVQYLFDEYGIE